MFEALTDWTPGTQKTQRLLDLVCEVVESYQEQGYVLTLRQLYYQLVARDYIPNEQRSYKRLIDLVTNARMGGYIDWSAIVDRGRVPVMRAQWSGPRHILNAAAQSYRLDRWEGQENYVEVWCEKDALGSVLEPVCENSHVRFLANHGYSSTTAFYDGAQRFKGADLKGKDCHLIYLGDHDPSGTDMTRDVEDRLIIMTQGVEIEVHRIALNYEQVLLYNPPPNRTKKTDSRSGPYVAEYGESSWELDALEPQVVTELLNEAIDDLMDGDLYEEALKQEESDKADLRRLAEEWIS